MISTAEAKPDLSALQEAQQRVAQLESTRVTLQSAVNLQEKSIADHKEEVVSLSNTLREMQTEIGKIPDPVIFSQIQSYGDSLSNHVLYTLPKQRQLERYKYDEFQNTGK